MKIVNRKAFRSYHILETLEAGVMLSGNEVKSIRAGRIDLGESFIKIMGQEAYLVNAHIAKLPQTSQKDYDPSRSRKLLLHKNQIESLIGKTAEKGNTLIPISIYEKGNRFKIEIGLAKPKKEYDKRRVIKERDYQRRVEQELRGKE